MGPHRVVTNALTGLATGAQGVISSVASGVKGAGESVMSGLDGPPRDVAGVQGPHRIPDRLLDAGVDAAQNFFSQGVVGSAKIGIEGVARALDQPLEQMGVGRMSRFPWRR